MKKTATADLFAKIDTMAELMHELDDVSAEALDQVQLLRMVRDTAESALRQAVPMAAARGATWDQIGRALGVSRQSAWERYR